MTGEMFGDLVARFALPDGNPSVWRVVPYAKEHGFSAARVWRLERRGRGENVPPAGPLDPGPLDPRPLDPGSGPGVWCLRAWPQDEPTGTRLAWIQQQILTAAATCPFILAPLPLRATGRVDPPQDLFSAGATPTPTSLTATTGVRFLEKHGQRWQVEPWARGKNDYLHRPSPTRLAQVMRALAQLHNVWIEQKSTAAHGPIPRRIDPLGVPYPAYGPSPGLRSRRQQVAAIQPASSTWLAQAFRQVDAWREPLGDEFTAWQELLRGIEASCQVADDAWCQSLKLAADWQLPLGPILADPWSDHLFFEADHLVALIDYGALRVDTAAADLSRCLSSLCGQDWPVRAWALQEYQAHRSLSTVELAAIDVFDRSSRWLGPWHWLRWLFVERRIAPNPTIRRRLQRIMAGQPF